MCSIKIKPVTLDLQFASTAEIFKGSSFVPLGEHRLLNAKYLTILDSKSNAEIISNMRLSHIFMNSI